jgi:hypothetical protein
MLAVSNPDGIAPEPLGAARLEIEVAGERYPAEASPRAVCAGVPERRCRGRTA